MRVLLCCLAVLLVFVSTGRAQRECVNTGADCRNVCLPSSNGEFQWCGGCEEYILCTDGVFSLEPCLGDLLWNDNAKACTPDSTTCTQCVQPLPLCRSTGPTCLVDCLGEPNGVYQYCGRCDYFLQCSSSTTFYTACQDENLDFDDSFKACIAGSTTCSDDPCSDGLPVGDCSSSPCYNGGTCVEEGNGYICLCAPGYTGETCLSTVDRCQSDSCLNGGTCYPSGDGYVCVCRPGYTGQTCQSVINTCASNPCINGGTCYGVVNEWWCECVPGWTGQRCESLDDQCASDPCANSGTCHNNCGGPVCDCQPGWTGDFCNTFIDSCVSDPCQHGGTCQNGFNRWDCICTPSYTGTVCETAVADACSSSPCINGGICVGNCGIYQCTCPPNYTGQRCETTVSPCVPNNCLNGGTCVPSGGSSYCDCLIDWTGIFCESRNYVVNDSCGDLDWTGYPAKNGFTIFCYYEAPLSDPEGRSRECRYTLIDLPIYDTYIPLLEAGGNFGCLVSQNYPADNPGTSEIACADNYQHSVTLGNFQENEKIMICIRYPYLGTPLEGNV